MTVTSVPGRQRLLDLVGRRRGVHPFKFYGPSDSLRRRVAVASGEMVVSSRWVSERYSLRRVALQKRTAVGVGKQVDTFMGNEWAETYMTNIGGTQMRALRAVQKIPAFTSIDEYLGELVPDSAVLAPRQEEFGVGVKVGGQKFTLTPIDSSGRLLPQHNSLAMRANEPHLPPYRTNARLDFRDADPAKVDIRSGSKPIATGKDITISYGKDYHRTYPYHGDLRKQYEAEKKQQQQQQ